MPVGPPPLDVPYSLNTVLVSVIDTTSAIYPPTSVLFEPTIKTHRLLEFPCYSFLIRHAGPDGDQQLLFDLGIRKDPFNLAPSVLEYTAQIRMQVEKDVLDILKEEKIAAVIWSHHHFDHIGDLSRFPPETQLVVGPGFKEAFIPGYPTTVDSWILESDYEGRTIRELDFSQDAGEMKIGGYKAYDYFGDGSFYLLNCPGHSIGHMAALARTTPTTFVLLSADCCHHGGELRPNRYLPLTSACTPVHSSTRHPAKLLTLGDLLEHAPDQQARSEPFYRLKFPGVAHDHDEAERSLAKLAALDAHDDVLVLMAHDPALKKVVNFWPQFLNAWQPLKWKEKLRWTFLDDFSDQEGLADSNVVW